RASVMRSRSAASNWFRSRWASAASVTDSIRSRRSLPLAGVAISRRYPPGPDIRRTRSDGRTGVVRAGDSGEPTEQVGKVSDLLVAEVRLEQRADRADMPARGRLEL